jgi:hypothetical protein
MPSMSSGGPAVSLTIESDPPGADAKTSLGASCRTPCIVPIAADREFTVSYALNGYLPQVIAVTPRMPDVTRGESEFSSVQAAELSPNPVFAQLQPAPPPPPVSRKGRGKARPKQVAKQRQQVVPPQ